MPTVRVRKGNRHRHYRPGYNRHYRPSVVYITPKYNQFPVMNNCVQQCYWNTNLSVPVCRAICNQPRWY